MLRDVLRWLPVLASVNTVQRRISHVHLCSRHRPCVLFQHVCVVMANLTDQAGLRCAGRSDLVVLRTATELCKRSFHTAAAVIWNSLREHLHLPSKGQFRCGLETHFFQHAYSL